MENFRLKGNFKRYLQVPLYLIAIFVILGVGAYFINPMLGIIAGAITVIYTVVVIVIYNVMRKKLLNQLVEFGVEQGILQYEMIEGIDDPLALLDAEGRYIWTNQCYANLGGKLADAHKSVVNMFPILSKEYLSKQGDCFQMSLTFADREYKARLRRLGTKEVAEASGLGVDEVQNSNYYSLHLNDVTEYNKARDERDRQQLVVALVYVDNYDEALGPVDNVKKSLLIALIDRKIEEYFSQADALVRKLEKDRYLVVFRQEFLKGLEDDKFSILETIKSVKAGNEIDITLSIGVGVAGNGYVETNGYAQTAIDLALGRGGSQVVVKNNENVRYYGGISHQVDRNTRVKARVMANALRELMLSNEKVIVMGHRISDADALGAAMGVYCAARELGKEIHIVLNEVTSTLRPIKDNFGPDQGYPEDLFVNSAGAMEIMTGKTLVMVVDTNRPSNVECPELLAAAKNIVVFDHHRQNSDVIENTAFSYVEPYASSACEMVVEVLQYFAEKVRIEPAEADAMYAGIIVDTNNFMTKTGVRTFEAAALLRRCGTEAERVRKLLREDMLAYKARAEVVRHAQVYKGAFAISQCIVGDVESPTILGAQAANELLNIVGIKASFVLTPFQGKTFISARSIDEINVQIIMEKMGGGGHLSVAGAQIKGYDIEGCTRRIEEILDEMMAEGEIKL